MLNNLLSVFSSYRKTTLKKELISFLKDVISQINEISQNPDPLDSIISLFNLMSVYYDNIDYFNKYSKILSEEDLSLIKNKIINLGRSDLGMNRTSEKEFVTKYNVFLGNVFGLVTKPISEWENNKNDKKGCWGWSTIYGIDSNNLNPYDVVCLQAKYYVENNISNLTEVLQYIISKLS